MLGVCDIKDFVGGDADVSHKEKDEAGAVGGQ